MLPIGMKRMIPDLISQVIQIPLLISSKYQVVAQLWEDFVEIVIVSL